MKFLRKHNRGLNAPYTCRAKDIILEIGKRMKFYKKEKKSTKKKKGMEERRKDSCTERQMSWNMTSD